MSLLIPSDLTASLWPDGDDPANDQVHAVVDGARDTRILPLLRATGLEYTCLFSGPLSPALQAAAPYLVHLSPSAALTRQVLELGWGQGWAVFMQAPAHVTLAQLRRHLRTLLRVQDEAGRILMFRFYDPSVLRTYLPTCTEDEVAQVLGPITAFAFENERADALLRFRREDARQVPMEAIQ